MATREIRKITLENPQVLNIPKAVETVNHGACRYCGSAQGQPCDSDCTDLVNALYSAREAAEEGRGGSEADLMYAQGYEWRQPFYGFGPEDPDYCVGGWVKREGR